MAISTQPTGDRTYIVLTDVVDIAQASELKQVLNEAIAASRVVIQVSAAASVDLTTVQLLWAAVSCSRLSGGEVVIEGPWSPQVEATFLASGLTPLLRGMVQSPAEKGADVLVSRN